MVSCRMSPECRMQTLKRGRGCRSKDAMGWRRVGEKRLSKNTPPKKRFCSIVVVALFFENIPRFSRPEGLLVASRFWEKGTFSGTFSSRLPHTFLRSTLLMAQTLGHRDVSLFQGSAVIAISNPRSGHEQWETLETQCVRLRPLGPRAVAKPLAPSVTPSAELRCDTPFAASGCCDRCSTSVCCPGALRKMIETTSVKDGPSVFIVAGSW